MAPALSAQTSGTSGNFSYTDNGTSITITDFPTSVVGDVAIPSTIKGKPVTSIGDYAFFNCSGLTSVSFPSSVTSIGYNAFGNCSGLTSVSIPAGVTSINSDTFYRCTGLTSVSIPSSVTYIETGAFFSCSSLTSVTIPSSVTGIGYSAFDRCTGLASISVDEGNLSYSSSDGVLFDKLQRSLIQFPAGKSGTYTIPSSVTNIGKWAFYGCSGLTDLSIPGSVNIIGGSAFAGCTGLTSVTIPSSVTSIESGAFQGCTGLTSLTIPAGVISIGIGAFQSCSSLTSITIPSGTTSLADYAFDGCSGLTNVSIPSSVTNIGSRTFQGCSGLTSVSIPVGVIIIGSSAFQGCTGLTSVSIPAGTTRLADSAFYGCSGLTSVSIPASVTNIGSGAFYGCTELVTITIPAAVTSLADYTFAGCSGLTSVSIPAGVTSIGYSTFNGCTGLTNVSIPSGVTSIGYSAFNGCSGLTSITIPAGVTSLADYTFAGCSGLTSVSISTGVTSIGNSAFASCSSLNNVTIPSSVTNIGRAAFYDCTALTSVTIPANVTNIERGAFLGCSGLASISVNPTNSAYSSSDGSLIDKLQTSLILCPAGRIGAYTIPAGVTSIGISAFQGCTGLTSVTIPSSVTNIGIYAFYGCTGLTGISIPSSVNSIAMRAFYSCTSLISVTIPASVTSLDNDAFQGCTGLVSISVNAANPIYSSSDGVLFNKLKNLLIEWPAGKTGAYIIPASVTSIGYSAFNGCTGLTSVTIPASVTSLGSQAFNGCTGLTSISIPAGVISIGIGAFVDCTGLTSVTIPASVTSLGSQAFNGCSELSSATFMGDAPTIYSGPIEIFDPSLFPTGPFDGVASGFKVYYLNGSSGFTSPTWHGYPAEQITLLTQTITFAQPSNHSFIEAPLTLSATSNSGLLVTFSVVSGPATIGVDGKTLTFTGKSGTVTVRATQSGSATYLPATVDRSFKVTNPVAQTIQFKAPTAKLMGAAPFDLMATATSGLPVTFSVVSGPATLGINGKTLMLTGAGTVVLQATQSGNTVYLPAKAVQVSFKVSQSAQKITFKPASTALMSAPPLLLAATSSSGLPVSFVLVSGPATQGVDGKTLTFTGAGSVVVRAMQAGNSVYLAAPAVQVTIKVSKAPQEITFTLPTKVTVDSSPLTLMATASSGLPVTYVVTGPATLSGQTLTLTGVGMVSVNASQGGNSTFMAAKPVVKKIKVTAAVAKAKSLVSKSITAPLSTTLSGNHETLLVGSEASSALGLPVGTLELNLDPFSGQYTAILTLANEADPLFFSGTIKVGGTAENPIFTGSWEDPTGASTTTVQFAVSDDGLVASVSQTGQIIAETESGIVSY